MPVLPTTDRPAALDNAPAPDPCHAVLVALRRISHAADLHSKRLAKATGLSVAQFVVLQTVRDGGLLTAGQIARAVSLSQGTITLILDRLEERGLVARQRSTRDRRVIHLQLTEAGAAALRQTPPLLRERFIARFRALPAAEQQRLVAALDQVAAMMGEDEPDALAPELAAAGTADAPA
jgi:DNA-binding MarR family transcriptional regulator